MSATPSVTISRVRSEPRKTRKLVDEPERRRDGAGKQQAEERIAQREAAAAPFGGEPCRIGAEAEEGALAESDDPRITQHQIDRESQKAERDDFGEQCEPRRHEKEEGKRNEPEQLLVPAPTRRRDKRMRRHRNPWRDGRRLAHRHRRSSARRRAGEEALRPQDQNHHHYGIDDEAADGRNIIFSGDVGEAEQQRGAEKGR